MGPAPAQSPLAIRLRTYLLFPLLGLLALPACKTPEEYSASADEETYALIMERRDALFGAPDRFHLDVVENSVREQAMNGEIQELSDLGIMQCLQIAAASNQSFLQQKESLYLSALNLTLERWRFGVRSETDGGASISGVGRDSTNAGVDGSFRLTKILGSGANIVLGIGSNLFRLVSTGDGWDVVSDLSLSVTQPLLRAAGAKVTLESLTQAERSLVYQVRNYERFRRTFAVSVARRVYGVLQAFDQLENEQRNLDTLMILSERNESLAEAGQLSGIEADQAKQDELRSVNRMVELKGDLERQLDEFKLFLGLPLQLEISLDRSEFDRLTDDSPLLDLLTIESAIELALGQRLEVQTSGDQLDDSERNLVLAADALRPGLGLSINANSTSEDGKPLRHNRQDVSWSLGLNLDPAWDDLPERNAYRRAEIVYGADLRNHERFLDEVQLDVREALRNTINAKERYRIQTGALELASRRVLSADMNLQAGRASTRDNLDAQDSLLLARNAVTTALIDLTLAQLDLQLNLEVLRVDETGMFSDPELMQTLTPENDVQAQ